MKKCPKIPALIPILFSFTVCYSNDGTFRAAGNQLIPMYETDVAAKKEILTIRRINAGQAAITVYYEFFNPVKDKELEVGFEAVSPSGDIDWRPLNGQQRCITHFTVNINGAPMPFKVAIVSSKYYFINGQYKSKTAAQVLKENENSDYVDFFYVYHFRAVFKQGLNIIMHTYTVDLSSSVEETYSLQYILTAAKRWANRQIDDFTLQIDMGDFQDICIPNTFFRNALDWQLPGGGKSITLKKNKGDNNGKETSEFFIRKGMIILQKKDFKPSGELNIHSFNSYRYDSPNSDNYDHFDSKRDPLPFSIEHQNAIMDPADELSKRLLRNLPFARRGNVFKSTELQSYYERQKWYVKDETYQPVTDQLTPKEKAWINKW